MEIESHSRGEHLQVGLGLADVACPAQVKATDRLGERAFDPGALGIARLKRRRVLSLPGLLQNLMLSLGAEPEDPRAALRPRTLLPGRTGNSAHG